MDKKITDQYQEIANILECEELGYALTTGGYIKPEMTDDPELKEAIKKAIDGCNTILRKIKPFMD